jgi:hypothetical protein
MLVFAIAVAVSGFIFKMVQKRSGRGSDRGGFDGL